MDFKFLTIICMVSTSCCHGEKPQAEQLADQVVVPKLKPVEDSPRLADSAVVPQPTLNLHTAVEEKCEISLLPTALCYVIDDSGEIHFCRILLDSGSQKNYITEEFVSKLNCKSTPVKFTVSGVGGNATPVNSKINLNISTRDFKHKFVSDFCVLKTITESLPCTDFPKKLIKWPSSISLADPDFNVSRKVDAILGINDFRLCLRDGQLNLGPNVPGLLQTSFGWVFCGNLVLIRNQLVANNSVCKFLQDDLTKFWTMEELPSQHLMSSSDAACEQLYVQSVSRDGAGRYEVDLPVKEELLPKLGDSFNMAFRCLLSLEKKLQSNPDLYKKYSDFIQEFVELGHAHWVTDFPDKSQPEFYMPHLAVIREKAVTTQLRVVFNASARSTSGLSLNDILYVGPVVQANLFEILMRFRLNKYAFICDMTKMYRQINVKNFQSLQRILWREPGGELRCLQLSTVTYGTAPASYLATRTLLKLVEDEGIHFPLASKVVLENTYCDDILAGSDSIDKTVQTMFELQSLLGKGQFELHKWYSNSPVVLRHIPEEKQTKCTFKFDADQDTAVKTLGLKWDPASDRLSVSCPDGLSNTKSTKRQVLTDIAKIFDPQGFVAPVTVFAKILMQSIWKANVGWDDEVPDHILKTWRAFCNNLPLLNTVSVPRLMVHPERCKLELHGFADGSTKAFGCVVYARCLLPNNQYTVHFICAKSRVAPIKTVTLARLELCAANMLAQLINNIAKVLNIDLMDVHCWSDAMITLSWIKADPSRWQVFVANRVVQIQDLTLKQNWRYVRTDDNPADAVSRGQMPEDFINNSSWFQGTSWLVKDGEQWPTQPQLCSAVPEERKSAAISKNVALSSQDAPESYTSVLFKRFSKWWRLLRTFAYVYRFVHNVRHPNSKLTGPVSVKELNEATNKIVLLVQKEQFSKEFQILTAAVPAVDTDHCKFTVNQIKYLNIFIDENKCLRVGGRLKHSSRPGDHKHPLLLPAKHHVTDLLILQEHERLLHAGIQATLSSLRSRFWPLHARNTVRKLIHSCVKCFRFQGQPLTQIMADLPKYRVTPARPFLLSGVDFAGPIQVKEWRSRKPQIHKGLNAESQANLKNCPSLSGQSMPDIMDRDNSGVERLVVYLYRAKKSREIISFIPSQEYQNCIEDMPEDAAGSLYRYENDSSIQLLFDRSPFKSIRYRLEPSTVITESPEDNWSESGNENETPNEGSHDYDATDDTGHYSPLNSPEDDNERPSWQIPVKQPHSHEEPKWSRTNTTHSENEYPEAPENNQDNESNELPGEIDSLPSNEYAEDDMSIEKPVKTPHDQSEPQYSDEVNAPISPNSKIQPVRIKPNDVPVFQRPEKNIAPIRPDTNLQPIVVGNNNSPVLQPQENVNSDLFEDSDEMQHYLASGQNHNLPQDNVSQGDWPPKKVNEELEINNQHPYLLNKPKGNHDNGYVDSNDSLNSYLNQGNQELDNNSQTDPYHKKLTEEDVENTRDQLNLVYKWHIVKVPRIDSNGRIYGWVWQRVKSPIQSKSMKWTYWESRGKNHHSTHWKTKSSSSSKYNTLYHQSLDDDIIDANFDLWLKKQFENMQNNGNKMPSSPDDLNTVRIAIEQVLKTNGILVKSPGELIDTDGNVLRLDNVNLRPIYIGRSLAYNHILKNSGQSMKYNIPANTPFLVGLLVSVINPAKTLGIVPLGITSLPGLPSNEGNVLLNSGRELHPVIIQSGIRRLILGNVSGDGKFTPKIRPKVPVKDENVSSSEEKPGFRIIGGSFAIGTGTPLANRGRSGKDENH